MKDYVENIKKYDAHPDDKAVHKLASDLRLVMQDPDARYVAASDDAELQLVAKNFAIGKLNASAESAHAAVAKVAEIMQAERHKNRVTFYYLVARQLGKLDSLHL